MVGEHILFYIMKQTVFLLLEDNNYYPRYSEGYEKQINRIIVPEEVSDIVYEFKKLAKPGLSEKSPIEDLLVNYLSEFHYHKIQAYAFRKLNHLTDDQFYQWVSGYLDGCGKFTLNYVDNKLKGSFCLEVKTHDYTTVILSQIRERLKCGSSLLHNKKEGMTRLYFDEADLLILYNKVFKKYPLLTKDNRYFWYLLINTNKIIFDPKLNKVEVDHLVKKLWKRMRYEYDLYDTAPETVSWSNRTVHFFDLNYVKDIIARFQTRTWALGFIEAKGIIALSNPALLRQKSKKDKNLQYQSYFALGLQNDLKLLQVIVSSQDWDYRKVKTHYFYCQKTKKVIQYNYYINSDNRALALFYRDYLEHFFTLFFYKFSLVSRSIILWEKRKYIKNIKSSYRLLLTYYNSFSKPKDFENLIWKLNSDLITSDSTPESIEYLPHDELLLESLFKLSLTPASMKRDEELQRAYDVKCQAIPLRLLTEAELELYPDYRDPENSRF